MHQQQQSPVSIANTYSNLNAYIVTLLKVDKSLFIVYAWQLIIELKRYLSMYGVSCGAW